MIENAVIAAMNEEIIGAVMKTAQRFRGKGVHVTIAEVDEHELERGRTS